MKNITSSFARDISRPSLRPDTLNRHAYRGVTAGLIGVVTYQLVLLVSQAFVGFGTEPVPALGATRVRHTSAQPPDYGALAQSHLFGEANGRAESVVAAVDVAAPETALDLTLTGILVQRGSLDSQAIIASGGTQKVYRLGDAIDGIDGVTLHSILDDRVLLSRNGRLEMLRSIFGDAPPALSAAVVANTEPATAESGLASDAIPTPQLRFSDFISASTKKSRETIVGVALAPLGNSAVAFRQAGLSSRDVVIEVNGVALDNRQGREQLFAALEESPNAALTVLRDGRYESVTLDTARLLASANARR